MIKMISIQFPFSESNLVNTQTTFTSFVAANNHLNFARIGAPKLGYHKTDFVLTYEDGETYKGRYDIKRNDYISLEEHVQSFCECYGGVKKPKHFDDGQWALWLKDGVHSEYAEFLKKYEL